MSKSPVCVGCRASTKAALRAGFTTLLLIAIVSIGLGQNPSNTVRRIKVDPRELHQTIDGFGVNFNGTYFREAQKPAIDMLIDDLGATIFRLDPYGLTNWEAVNDNDDAKVINWEYYNDRYTIPTFEASWAAARYLNSRGLRPFMTLSGTVPDWMLDASAPAPKHRVCNAGTEMARGSPAKPSHLKPAMYDEFAEEVVSMLVYARTRARIGFDYFSPLNETDCYPAEGPRVDPEEMPAVLEAVARRMRSEGLGDVKLVVADQAIVSNDYIGPILEHDDLMKQVGAFSLHTYGSDSVGPQVERVHRSKYPDVPVWLTEYGDLNDLDRSAENDWKGFSLAATERALRALNQGASAALYWDGFDNYHEHYPRLTFYGLLRNSDHLYAPKKRYYAAKQLYHFVRPGARRMAASTEDSGLLVTAFRDPAAEAYVIVGASRGGPKRVQVALPGGVQQPSAWELYETTPTLDCARVDSIAVKEGRAELDLPEEAVFTLVGPMK